MKGRFLIFSTVLVAVFIAGGLVIPTSAHAAGYLDPGSGSTIAQGVIAAAAVVSRFFRRIKSFFIR